MKYERCVNLGHGHNEALHSPTIITSRATLPHSKPRGTNSDLPSQQSPQYSLFHLSNTKWLAMIQPHLNMLVKKNFRKGEKFHVHKARKDKIKTSVC